MQVSITLVGDEIAIDVSGEDYYQKLLDAITKRVFALLGPEFDKEAFLAQVEGRRSAVDVGQELAIPVSMLLALELGYCLGQLKALGKTHDADQSLADLYEIWKARLRKILREEMDSVRTIH